jgi:group I intron endonuclease
LSNNKLTISKALLKYGYSKFKLEILEYCNKNDLITREQYYLDLFKPEYNILKVAGSLSGFKHSESTRERLSKFYSGRVFSKEVRKKISLSLKGRVHTVEALAKMSEAKLGYKKTEEHKNKISASSVGRTHTDESKFKISKTRGTAIVVYNIETGEKLNFPSVRSVSRHFSVSNNTIARYIKSGTLFQGKYKINKQL